MPIGNKYSKMTQISLKSLLQKIKTTTSNVQKSVKKKQKQEIFSKYAIWHIFCEKCSNTEIPL